MTGGDVAPWMRAVSFAGMHRVLKAVSDSPTGGLRAGEINAMVQSGQVPLGPRSPNPSPTTLYHYRNTMIRLRALVRDGRVLRTNEADRHVRALLRMPPPASRTDSLDEKAKTCFAALVLKNDMCRTSFFDLFMPRRTSIDSVSTFRTKGTPVTWARDKAAPTDRIVLENGLTGRSASYSTPVQIAAIPYGVRYWARDELELIDEYCQGLPPKAIMFPVHNSAESGVSTRSVVIDTVRLILSQRKSAEWTVFPISELITRCCERRRQPRRILFGAIEWFTHQWPHHVALIGTSRSVATLTSGSPSMDSIILRNYYRDTRGTRVSHIRIHRYVQPPEMEPEQ